MKNLEERSVFLMLSTPWRLQTLINFIELRDGQFSRAEHFQSSDTSINLIRPSSSRLMLIKRKVHRLEWTLSLVEFLSCRSFEYFASNKMKFIFQRPSPVEQNGSSTNWISVFSFLRLPMTCTSFSVFSTLNDEVFLQSFSRIEQKNRQNKNSSSSRQRKSIVHNSWFSSFV